MIEYTLLFAMMFAIAICILIIRSLKRDMTLVHKDELTEEQNRRFNNACCGDNPPKFDKRGRLIK